ncbi:kinesin light chain 3-like isoform X1 [Quillaja saponaria]|uniref:Kinesin light chain 3-like isoform X1 n=1 Tax=Quillaja saponaria TaxID=32244 RepID=A0AAD7LUF5_QUISA|nr:kinesin light chain 3-like isoform X1 [Quillaja saponaria]
MKTSEQYGSGSGAYSWRTDSWDPHLWIVLCGNVSIVLGINANPVFARETSTESSSGNDTQVDDLIGLRKIKASSISLSFVSDSIDFATVHSKICFLAIFYLGKLEEAEKMFLSAVQEAKEGFGVRDPHVASACNNLAELYRVKKAFNRAGPLYLDAISILEQSFGPEDIRVVAAYHNLAHFYVLQRQFEEAGLYYEIMGRVLGYGHAEYVDAMYHLGKQEKHVRTSEVEKALLQCISAYKNVTYIRN